MSVGWPRSGVPADVSGIAVLNLLIKSERKTGDDRLDTIWRMRENHMNRVQACRAAYVRKFRPIMRLTRQERNHADYYYRYGYVIKGEPREWID